jgi:hypothetical protein
MVYYAARHGPSGGRGARARLTEIMDGVEEWPRFAVIYALARLLLREKK